MQKWLLLCLLLCLLLALADCHPCPTTYSYNFNQSNVAPLSLENPSLNLQKVEIKRLIHNRFALLQTFPLKRYEFVDSDFRASELPPGDEALLRSLQTPVQVFDEYRIVLQNYQLLTERDFKVTLVNPTASLTFCVKHIYVDSPDIKLVEHHKTPICLTSKTKYPFFFKLHVEESKVRVLKAGIFFIIDVIDIQSKQFVEQKLWGKEIVVQVSTNWLKLAGAHQINMLNSFPFETIEVTNPTGRDLLFNASSNTNQLAPSNQHPSMKKLYKIQLKRGESLRLVTQKRTGEIFFNSISNPQLQSIRLRLIFRPEFYIDSVNIGIIPSKKSPVETLIYVTNRLNEQVLIHDMTVVTKGKSMMLVPLDGFNSFVPAKVDHYPVTILRIYPTIGDDQWVKSSIRMSYSGIEKEVRKAQTIFNHLEIVNPLTGIQKRFIHLDKGLNLKTKKKFQDTLFSIKNSLNIPLKLSNVLIDQTKFKVTWLTEKREYIYPNQNSFLFGFDYIQQNLLPLPAVTETMVLQFNGNILIPIEIVVYDKTLECQYLNVKSRCINSERVNLGNLRSHLNNSREFVINNPNPNTIRVTLTRVPPNNSNTSLRVKGPTPSVDEFERPFNDTIILSLKGRNRLLLLFNINCDKAGYYNEKIHVATEEQSFDLDFRYRVSQGVLSLHPNPLTILNIYEAQSSLVYMVSTYSQRYSILSITSDIPEITASYTKDVIQPHEVKEIVVKYVPALKGYCDFKNILIDVARVGTQNARHGLLRVKSSEELEQTASVMIKSGNEVILKKRLMGPVEIVQKSVNNKLLMEVSNPYNLTLKVKVGLVDPHCVKYSQEAAKVHGRNLQRYYFYICMTEAVKTKLRLNPTILRTLLHIQCSPTQVFIEALENGSFYIQWHHKQQIKSTQAMEADIPKRILSSIISGSRYCFKGEAARFFRDLFNLEWFIKMMQTASAEEFFSFMEREYEYVMNPSVLLHYDPFYQKLNLNASKCLFSFCNYVPIEYDTGEISLQPNQTVNVSLRVKESSTQIRPVTFVVTTNLGKVESTLITFKHMKMVLKVQNIIDPHSNTSQQLAPSCPNNELKIQLTDDDIKQEGIMGERVMVLRNVGDLDINISSALFEDSLDPEVFEGLEVVSPENIYIPEGGNYNLTLRFKLSAPPTKPISLYLYSPTNFYFRFKILVFSNGILKSFSKPESLYFMITLTVLSISYIVVVLQLVLKEKEEVGKKSLQNAKAQAALLAKPKRVPVRLDMDYWNSLKSKLVESYKEEQESSRSEPLLKNVEEILSVSISRESLSARQEEQLSIGQKSDDVELSKEMQNSEQHRDIFQRRDEQLDSEEELGSGSSLSDQIFEEINRYAIGNSRWDHSNSDQNQVESNESVRHYNAFLSGGPLFIRKQIQEDSNKREASNEREAFYEQPQE